MDSLTFLAVLLAAACHAGWNTLLKGGADRERVMLLLSLSQGGIGVALTPFVPLPAAPAWGLLVLAGGLHAGYMVFLTRAYAHADLSQAYPLARGTAPLAVTVISLLFLGERITAPHLLAICMISGGLLTIALARGAISGQRISGAGLGYALGTAAFITSYTLCDGMGARLSGSAQGYAAWLFVADGMATSGWVVATRGRSVLTGLSRGWQAGALAGALSFASYAVAIWAFTRAPVPLVSALRESSILFAMLIAVVILREKVGPVRIGAAVLMASGIALMRL